MESKINQILENQKIMLQELSELKVKRKKTTTKKQNVDMSFVYDFVACWNEWSSPPVPKIKTVSDTRIKKIANLKKHYSSKIIKDTLTKCFKSKFLKGQSTGFYITPDFFLNRNNFIKIMEGNYDNNRKETKNNLSELGKVQW